MVVRLPAKVVLLGNIQRHLKLRRVHQDDGFRGLRSLWLAKFDLNNNEPIDENNLPDSCGYETYGAVPFFMRTTESRCPRMYVLVPPDSPDGQGVWVEVDPETVTWVNEVMLKAEVLEMKRNGLLTQEQGFPKAKLPIPQSLLASLRRSMSEGTDPYALDDMHDILDPPYSCTLSRPRGSPLPPEKRDWWVMTDADSLAVKEVLADLLGDSGTPPTDLDGKHRKHRRSNTLPTLVKPSTRNGRNSMRTRGGKVIHKTRGLYVPPPPAEIVAPPTRVNRKSKKNHDEKDDERIQYLVPPDDPQPTYQDMTVLTDVDLDEMSRTVDPELFTATFL